MIKKSIFLTVIILSLLTLQAKPRKKTSENLPLHNTKWVLKEVFETPVFRNPDTAFIVFYDNFTFSGNLGCNTFFGEYSYRKKRMKLDYLGATKKLCTNMNVEEQFLKAIKYDITHYIIEKNKLYLLNNLVVICKFESN
ncbi:MAG: META domain-containing protein [Bacteroidetes bacterium]|nr:META domain-containing protein [Bacteroidota bacterium]MCL1968481.1 META domain-containing protein [Bacteroidota bacterium]